MIPGSKDFMMGVFVGLAGGFIGAYVCINYPNLGFGIVLDGSLARVHEDQTYEQVIDILGPEQGRLSDELVRLNATSRGYDSQSIGEKLGIPNEVGGENLFWLNQSDGRALLVVSFGKGRTVRKKYFLEFKHFVR